MLKIIRNKLHLQVLTENEYISHTALLFMRILFLISMLIISLVEVKAQDTRHVEFIFGYGFYEGINIGSIIYFKPKTHAVSFSVGYDRFMKQTNMAALASYDIAIFRKHITHNNHFKWHVNNKVVFWQLEDKYYRWRALSLVPAINRTFSAGKKLDFSIDFGPSFNIVLNSKRKTFEEVGWPYHVMPDFRILLML